MEHFNISVIGGLYSTVSKCPDDTNNFQWEFSNFLKFLHYIDRVKPSENSSPPAFNGNQNIEAVEPHAGRPGAERQEQSLPLLLRLVSNCNQYLEAAHSSARARAQVAARLLAVSRGIPRE